MDEMARDVIGVLQHLKLELKERLESIETTSAVYSLFGRKE
jgi:hypothetical protein